MTRSTRLAIEYLPNLKILDCYDSVQALSQIFREGVATQSASHDSSSQQRTGSVLRQFPLTNLHWIVLSNKQYLPPYVSRRLANAVQLCPFVVRVAINGGNQVVKDSELLALLELDNLRHLQLFMINVSFDGGIVPILEKFGHNSLEILELESLNVVDIAAIVRHCSNLRSLILIENEQYSGPSPSQLRSDTATHQLRHLEHLNFFNADLLQPDPTAATISYLLRSCSEIVSLHLIRLSSLTDQVIQEAVRAHGFSKLEKLVLACCHDVSKSSIDLLFSMDCPFKEIELCDCEQLNESEEYAAIWQKKAMENNWNLTISDD